MYVVKIAIFNLRHYDGEKRKHKVELWAFSQFGWCSQIHWENSKGINVFQIKWAGKAGAPGGEKEEVVEAFSGVIISMLRNPGKSVVVGPSFKVR